MHGSLGHFKATLQRKKERSESRDRGNFSRKKIYATEGKLADETNHPKMSVTEFSKFKLKLKAERKRQNFNDRLLLIIVFGGLIALWAYLLY